MRFANGKSMKWTILGGLALTLTLAGAGTGFAQTQSGDVTEAPLLWKLDPLGLGAILPTTCSANEDNNGDLLIGYPGLDGGPTGVPGWVAGLEVGVVNPHVSNHLFSPVTRASGVTDPNVQLPSAQIEATVMPKFEFGYRFGEASGELLVSYRFLNGAATNSASGAVVPSFGPGGVQVASRLSLNTIDIDYGSWEPITVLGTNMKWRMGVRTMIEFNDSQANSAALNQSVNNYYAGAGPHAMVDFYRPIFHGSGLSLFGRIEATYFWGTLDQNYTETAATPAGADFGQQNYHIYTQVTMLGLQAGVNWVVPWNPNIHVSGGYIFEHTWDLGSLFPGSFGREELDINGGFVRFEWNY